MSAASAPNPRPLEDVAGRTAAFFEDVFSPLTDLRGTLVTLFEAGTPRAEIVDDVVHPWAKEQLDAGGPLLGCGYVAARDALTDKSLYLSWWQGESRQLLGEAHVPSGSPADYTRREWFNVPASTGERHITGPYVDYVCTDEYVVTSTAPVEVRGEIVGIVGADILAETLESIMLELLRPLGATLVSGNGRIVASADHRLATGSLVDLASFADHVPCAALPLAVVR